MGVAGGPYNRELTATEVKQVYDSMKGRLD